MDMGPFFKWAGKFLAGTSVWETSQSKGMWNEPLEVKRLFQPRKIVLLSTEFGAEGQMCQLFAEGQSVHLWQYLRNDEWCATYPRNRRCKLDNTSPTFWHDTQNSRYVPVVQYSWRIAASFLIVSGGTFNSRMPFWSSEADNEIWGLGMDRVPMQKYIDVSLQLPALIKHLHLYSRCHCTCLRNLIEEWKLWYEQFAVAWKASSISPQWNHMMAVPEEPSEEPWLENQSWGWEIETWKPHLQRLTWDSELPTWGPSSTKHLFRRNFTEQRHAEWGTCITRTPSARPELRASSLMALHMSKAFHTPVIPLFALLRTGTSPAMRFATKASDILWPFFNWTTACGMSRLQYHDFFSLARINSIQHHGIAQFFVST